MDQQQHMTKTEAHPYHNGSKVPVSDPNCPICRKKLDLALLARHAADEHWEGPFVVNEYMALPGDVRAFIAQEQMRGICCAGRESRELAEQDEQGLNAAFRWGLEVGEHKARNQ